MNRGFKQYFKESFKSSFKDLKKFSNYIRYLLFMLVDFFASLIYLLKPVTDMALIRMTKNLRNKKDIVISNTISTGTKPKSYWTYLMVECLKALIIFGIILLFAALIGLLVLLGYSVMWIIGDADYVFLMLVFSAPAIIGLCIFLCAIRYLTVPTGYLVDSYPNFESSQVLYSSIESVKRCGKKVLFVNDLVHALIFVALLLPITILIAITGSMGTNLGVGLQMLFIFALLVEVLWILPPITLSARKVRVALFDDIVLDDKTVVQKLTRVQMDKFDTSSKTPMKKRLLSAFESDEQMNLEAKLFREIPVVKVKSVQVEKQPESVLKPIVSQSVVEEIPTKHKVIVVETPVEETLVVKEEPVVVEEKPVVLEEEIITEEVLETTTFEEKPVVVEETPVVLEEETLTEEVLETPILEEQDLEESKEIADEVVKNEIPVKKTAKKTTTKLTTTKALSKVAATKRATKKKSASKEAEEKIKAKFEKNYVGKDGE